MHDVAVGDDVLLAFQPQLAGIARTGLTAMAISPFAGFLVVLESIAGVVVGIVFSRIAAELILIVFRINEHLGAIRDQGGGVR